MLHTQKEKEKEECMLTSSHILEHSSEIHSRGGADSTSSPKSH